MRRHANAYGNICHSLLVMKQLRFWMTRQNLNSESSIIMLEYSLVQNFVLHIWPFAWSTFLQSLLFSLSSFVSFISRIKVWFNNSMEKQRTFSDVRVVRSNTMGNGTPRSCPSEHCQRKLWAKYRTQFLIFWKFFPNLFQLREGGPTTYSTLRPLFMWRVLFRCFEKYIDRQKMPILQSLSGKRWQIADIAKRSYWVPSWLESSRKNWCKFSSLKIVKISGLYSFSE